MFPPHFSPASFSLHVPIAFLFPFPFGSACHRACTSNSYHLSQRTVVVCGLWFAVSSSSPRRAPTSVMLRGTYCLARTGIPLERPLVGPPIFQQRDPPAPCSKTHKTCLDPCNRGLCVSDHVDDDHYCTRPEPAASSPHSMLPASKARVPGDRPTGYRPHRGTVGYGGMMAPPDPDTRTEERPEKKRSDSTPPPITRRAESPGGLRQAAR